MLQVRATEGLRGGNVPSGNHEADQAGDGAKVGSVLLFTVFLPFFPSRPLALGGWVKVAQGGGGVEVASAGRRGSAAWRRNATRLF